jgi:hypothetical protein
VPRPPAALRALALVLTLLAASASCREAARRLGTTPGQARSHADTLFGALALRFGPARRDSAFEQVRPKLARSAFVPSRLFRDASVWTAAEHDARRVELAGGAERGRYVMAVRAGAPAPSRPADYKGVIGLRTLREGEFEWSVRDELAVGGVAASQLGRAFTALLAAAGTTAPADARDRLRETLPRSARALGRLASLDALELRPAPDGASDVSLAATLDPSLLAREYPRYSRFLEKYLGPARFEANAFDVSGASRFWQAALRERTLRLRLRVRGGELVAFEGQAVPVPDTLRVRSDVSVKLGIFRVGARGLEAEVALTREPGEKSFLARFRQEPSWELPPLARPMLRGPLRRPFEGGGSSLSFAARDGSGPTLLTREYRLFVKESWILRWLGGLGSGALSEFRRGAEEEADRFSGEVMKALHDDVLALFDGAAETARRPQPIGAVAAAPAAREPTSAGGAGSASSPACRNHRSSTTWRANQRLESSRPPSHRAIPAGIRLACGLRRPKRASSRSL